MAQFDGIIKNAITQAQSLGGDALTGLLASGAGVSATYKKKRRGVPNLLNGTIGNSFAITGFTPGNPTVLTGIAVEHDILVNDSLTVSGTGSGVVDASHTVTALDHNSITVFTDSTGETSGAGMVSYTLESSVSVKVFKIAYTAQEINESGGLITAIDKRLMMRPIAGLDPQEMINDTLLIGSVEHSILNVKEDPLDLAWTLQVR